MIAPDAVAGKGLLEALARQRDTTRYWGKGEHVISAPNQAGATFSTARITDSLSES
jgi:hypothetical protein